MIVGNVACNKICLIGFSLHTFTLEKRCRNVKNIHNLLNKIDYVLALISASTIVVMMGWIFIDVILRYFFNRPLVGTIEITGEYFLIIIVFLAVSFTQKEKGHVNVDLVQSKISKQAKRYLSIISNVIALVVFILLGFHNLMEGVKKFQFDVRSVGLLDYPIGPAFIIIFIGITFLSIRLFVETILLIQNRTDI